MLINDSSPIKNRAAIQIALSGFGSEISVSSLGLITTSSPVYRTLSISQANQLNPPSPFD